MDHDDFRGFKAIITVILILLAVIYLSFRDKDSHNDKIIKASSSYCNTQEQYKNARDSFNKCITIGLTPSIKNDERADVINECSKTAYAINNIRIGNNDGPYDSDMEDYNDNYIMSQLPLDDGTIYKATCSHAPLKSINSDYVNKDIDVQQVASSVGNGV